MAILWLPLLTACSVLLAPCHALSMQCANPFSAAVVVATLSAMPLTHAGTSQYIQLPTFGSRDVIIGPAKGNASAKFIRPGVKGGISISRTCKNCADFIMYAGWNMPGAMVVWQVSNSAKLANQSGQWRQRRASKGVGASSPAQ